MKSLLCLFTLAMVCKLVQAQPASDAPLPLQDKTHVSLIAGSGLIDGSGERAENAMKWRAVDMRFGREFKPGFGGWRLPQNDALRWDIVYFNEGHPENNHRDGFALQAIYARTFASGLAVEWGAGPYTSMNTTTNKRGKEINQARLGALFSLALRLPLASQSDSAYLRLGYNHAAVPHGPASNAFMLGLGKTFGDSVERKATSGAGEALWIEGGAGWASTNARGTADSPAFSLSAKRYWDNWAASVSAIEEGDDGQVVKQRGVALQGWRLARLDEYWSVGAGLGPYLARNEREAGGSRLLALLTLQVNRALTRHLTLFVNFHRAQTFREKNDRDVFLIGLARQFGG